MAVSAVHLESDAFLVCMNHALSTEKEEVMGLCIGEVDTNRIVHIHSVIILRRSDKRKDRVEISPEQLSSAATEAERLADMTGRPMRVVGWYHSHPHITVWPSHVGKNQSTPLPHQFHNFSFHCHGKLFQLVCLRHSFSTTDVRTQAMYQMMDQGFVGLIFSCFIEDKNTKTGRVLYTCFQSIQAQKGSEYERIEIPIHVVPHEAIGKVCLESAVELPRILCQEEQDTYRKIHREHTMVHIVLQQVRLVAVVRCGLINMVVTILRSQNSCSTLCTIALWDTIITSFINWLFRTVPLNLTFNTVLSY
uniref:lys-63-specific deubiquitinase BRCC36 isoform X1 n=1 Tax=Oncorhynchus gorbuscha TaxID=8017 RepID=UPI001EAE89A9|nr:lys-63-specific deubiquitinase BRCC36 isoform X1 [Oncorhynchus gorbuscha]